MRSTHPKAEASLGVSDPLRMNSNSARKLWTICAGSILLLMAGWRLAVIIPVFVTSPKVTTYPRMEGFEVNAILNSVEKEDASILMPIQFHINSFLRTFFGLRPAFNTIVIFSEGSRYRVVIYRIYKHDPSSRFIYQYTLNNKYHIIEKRPLELPHSGTL